MADCIIIKSVAVLRYGEPQAARRFIRKLGAGAKTEDRGRIEETLLRTPTAPPKKKLRPKLVADARRIFFFPRGRAPRQPLSPVSKH